MKPGTSYPLNTAMALLLLGEPGSGKTCTAMTFPAPWFADCDGNIRSAKLRFPDKEFWFDTIDVDENDKPVPAQDRWLRLVACLKAAGQDPKVQTIVLDSLTKISEYLQAYIISKGSQAEKPLQVGGISIMTMSLWNPFRRLTLDLIGQARLYKKPVIVIAHTKREKDEITGVVQNLPNIQGSLDNDLAGVFTDVWLCETTPNGAACKYEVITVPTNRIKLKSSTPGLPARFEFSWDKYLAVQPGASQTSPGGAK